MIREKIDKERELTIHVFSGVILAEDLIEAVKTIYQSEPTPNHLWDLTAADLSQLKGQDLSGLSKFAKQQAPDRKGGRTAFVSSSALGFGLARMYQSFAEGYGQQVDIKVFHSREEAENWISKVPD